MRNEQAEIRRDEETAVSPVIATILMVAITVVLAGVLYVWANNLAAEGTDTSLYSLNSFTAQDAVADTTAATDDILLRLQMTGKDKFSWTFISIRLSVGDSVYTCGVGTSDDCSIDQQAGDVSTVWEPAEFILLKENGVDICGASTCPLRISVNHYGLAVAGTPSVLIMGADVPEEGTGGGSPESCSDVFAYITTQSDVSRYSQCTDLDGIYLHQTSGVTDVTLPYLEAVYGYVYFHQNEDLETVSFPNLEEVGEYVYFHQNVALETVSFPNLEEVDRYVYFHDNDNLQSIEMQSLQHVTGYLYINGNDGATELDLTISLTAVDDYVYIYNNPSLCVPNLDWDSISDSVTMSGNGDC
jgi:flagellin-like protein